MKYEGLSPWLKWSIIIVKGLLPIMCDKIITTFLIIGTTGRDKRAKRKIDRLLFPLPCRIQTQCSTSDCLSWILRDRVVYKSSSHTKNNSWFVQLSAWHLFSVFESNQNLLGTTVWSGETQESQNRSKKQPDWVKGTEVDLSLWLRTSPYSVSLSSPQSDLTHTAISIPSWQYCTRGGLSNDFSWLDFPSTRLKLCFKELEDYSRTGHMKFQIKTYEIRKQYMTESVHFTNHKSLNTALPMS